MESSLAMSGSGEISACEHSEYQVFCQNHEKILCLECAFSDHQNCGGQKSKTLKQAAAEQMQKFEEILLVARDHQSQCS